MIESASEWNKEVEAEGKEAEERQQNGTYTTSLSPTTPGKVVSGVDPSKKKRSPNWLPQEDEQLAQSWLKVSDHARFINKPTSDTFYKALEADFNIHSRLHYRDHLQIRVRWAALNTATLKFSSIYNAIERSPPENSTPDDWMSAARKIYLQQSRGHAFKDELAWRKLREAPKWRLDNKRLHFHSSDSPDLSIEVNPTQELNQPLPTTEAHPLLIQQQQDQALLPSGSSITTPQDLSPISNSLCIQNAQGAPSKRLRLEHSLERLISRNQEDSIESIPVIPTDPNEPSVTLTRNTSDMNHNQTDIFHEIQNESILGGHSITSLIDLDEINQLKKENLALDRDSKRSQIEMNNLKLILQSEADCPDEDSVMLLRLMKSRLKKRLLSQEY